MRGKRFYLSDADEKVAKRAWQMQSLADQTLHSRIQAMLVAEAFLVGAYATAAGMSELKSDKRFWLELLVIVFGVLVTVLFGLINLRLAQKMIALDNSVVRKVEPLRELFMTSSRIPEGKWLHLHIWFPILCLLFWIGVAVFPFGREWIRT